MTITNISAWLKNVSVKTLKISSLLALLLVGMLMSVRPAQAQNGDAWKSAVIIGGSTIAGAYIGHRVAGSTGAYIGAAAGAAAGYAIDRYRRDNEYNNGYYSNNGPYYGNGGYYGNNGPYYGNGGYNGGGPNPYPAGYPNNNLNHNRRGR